MRKAQKTVKRQIKINEGNSLNHFDVESYQCSKCGECSEELENIADWVEDKEWLHIKWNH